MALSGLHVEEIRDLSEDVVGTYLAASEWRDQRDRR